MSRQRLMTRVLRSCGMLGTAAIISAVLAAAPALAPSPAQAQVAKPTPDDLALGQRVFFKRCVWCHGPKGDGEGPAMERAFPKPRNFNPGTFKIRTTDSGELPIDADLIDRKSVV